MKKIIIIVALLLLAIPAKAFTPTASGVQQSGAVTAGHCAQWLGKSIVVDSGAPCGGSSWGSITGTLSNQTDLQNALNAKQATITGAPGTWPSFSTVATSGSYNDLLNRPFLFSGSYTDLTNKPSLFSGSYTDLTNKPSIPAAQVNSDWNASSGVAQILNKPSLFSGSYTDLTNKPSLFSGSYTDLTNKPTLGTAAAHDVGYFDLAGAASAAQSASLPLHGTADLATALAATPSQCSGGNFATGVAANGNANCATPAGSGNVSGPGSSTSGYVPTWSGTTGISLAVGLPVGTTGNSTLVETGTTGLIASSIVPTLNQATTAQAGSVATISGLLSAGSNVTITGSGTSASPYSIAATGAIGGSVTSGTANSILYVGTGPVLAQDNTNFGWTDASTYLHVGPALNLTNYPSTWASFVGTSGSNNYGQVIIQDLNANGQGGLVVGGDNMTNTTHYGQIYMNGSGSAINRGPTNIFFSNPNALSIYSTDNEVDIGALGTTGAINFYVNGYTTPGMTIGTMGVGIGTTSITNPLTWFGTSSGTAWIQQPASGVVYEQNDTTSIFLSGTTTGSAVVNLYGQAYAYGTGSTAGGGHVVGIKGEATFAGSGSGTLSRAIGLEGSVLVGPTATGTISTAVSNLAYLQLNSNAGVTLSNYYGYYVSPAADNAGTIASWVDYYSPNIGTDGGGAITTKWSLKNDDTGKLITTLGNVGIGTATPAAALDVYAGGIHIGSSTPSPTTNDLYAIGTSLYWNGSAIGSSLSAIGSNTLLANATASSAVPTAVSIPSCVDSSGNHLNYTLATGFSCGTTSSGGGSISITAASSNLVVSPSPITGTGTVDLAAAPSITTSLTSPYINVTTINTGYELNGANALLFKKVILYERREIT